MPLRTITEVNDLRGTRVLVRAGLNVPLVEGIVRDDFRITNASETILYLKEKGARVIVVAHIGREPGETLAPVYESMKKIVPLTFAGALTGEKVAGALATLRDGEVLLLENVRSDAREEENDEAFARELASYADIFVNDAFADSHRTHASIVGIPAHIPSYAGILFAREYETLRKAFAPENPSLFILGGAKFETKMPLVERFVEKYDSVFIGGAIANDFLKGRGYEVGASVVSDVDLSSSPLLSHPRIIVPTDVIVSGPSGRVTKDADMVSSDESIYDAGPRTLAMLAPLIKDAKTIVWNGPLGFYEKEYREGTDALATMIAESEATSILGGGDTVASIENLHLEEKFSFVSTAGGAMLVFLETETLPGIEALRAR